MKLHLNTTMPLITRGIAFLFYINNVGLVEAFCFHKANFRMRLCMHGLLLHSEVNFMMISTQY